MGTRPSQLLQRVERVLGDPPVAPRRGGVLLCAVLGGVALVALACTGPAISTGSGPEEFDSGAVAGLERPAGDSAEQATLETLAALGYVAVPEPQAQPLGSRPQPGVRLTIDKSGVIRLGNELVLPADSDDLARLQTCLIRAVEGLRRSPITPGSRLLVVDAPIRITMAEETAFRRARLVMQACGQRDVALPNIQLDASNSMGVIPVALPRDVPPAVELDAEGQPLSDPPPPLTLSSITLEIDGSRFKLSFPDRTPLEFDLDLKGEDGGQAQAFERELMGLNAKYPEGYLSVHSSDSTTAAQMAAVLLILDHASLLERIAFVGVE